MGGREERVRGKQKKQKACTEREDHDDTEQEDQDDSNSQEQEDRNDDTEQADQDDSDSKEQEDRKDDTEQEDRNDTTEQADHRTMVQDYGGTVIAGSAEITGSTRGTEVAFIIIMIIMIVRTYREPSGAGSGV